MFCQMNPIRAVIFGNSGAGKTTLVRRLWGGRGIPVLTLDNIAWLDTYPPRRRADELAFADIDRFTGANGNWVVEGCYGSLISHAAASANLMYFLNIGVEACVSNCRARLWEPNKYPSREAQDENIEMLVAWVRMYEQRDDDCSLAAHRRIFETFPGEKFEIRSNDQSSKSGVAGNS